MAVRSQGSCGSLIKSCMYVKAYRATGYYYDKSVIQVIHHCANVMYSYLGL